MSISAILNGYKVIMEVNILVGKYFDSSATKLYFPCHKYKYFCTSTLLGWEMGMLISYPALGIPVKLDKLLNIMHVIVEL
jgi:hypothetical protein